MQINARDWIFQVSADPGGEPSTWATIRGLESFTLSASEGEETVDTTVFESEGYAEGQVMQRGASLSVEGKHTRSSSGQHDPGQATAEELAALVGEDSLGGVRFRHKSDNEWTEWDAYASLGDTGGGTNEKTSWSATFTRSGRPTTTSAS